MAGTTKSPEVIAPGQVGARALGGQRALLLFAAVCGAHAMVLGAVAAHRAVNADEGFYLTAGWRVLAGQRPYADFFFPQMPYLAYLEAWAFKLTGPSLWAGRMLSVATGAVLAGVLAVAAGRQTGSARVGIAVALAYAGNALLLSYVSIAKTYGVANLMVVSAFLLVTAPGTSVARSLAGGACAGLAVGTRLPVAAVLLVLLIWSARGGWRPVLAFGTGVAISSLPWLWVAAHDAQNFWFCNFAFHALRREVSGVGPILRQKGIVLAKWLLLPQNALLWILALAGLRSGRREHLAAAASAAALAAVYLWATPTYLEYLVQVIPFLLLAAIPAMAVLLSRRYLVLGAAALYCVGLLLARRSATDESARGAKARLWKLTTVQAVATHLHAHSEPDDRILSWWEGYPFLARRTGFTGVGFWESNTAKKLQPAARRRLHVLPQSDIQQLIVTRQPKLIVFPEGTWRELRGAVNEYYRLAERFGAIQVFERRDGAAAVPLARGPA